MKYTVWYYKLNKDSEFYKAYDCFTGSLYACRKFRKLQSFRHQYKIHFCIW